MTLSQTTGWHWCPIIDGTSYPAEIRAPLVKRSDVDTKISHLSGVDDPASTRFTASMISLSL